MNNAIAPLPKKCRIGVPSGVGDVYWVLGKLQDFRRKNNLEHVTLCVHKSKVTRALDWSKMVDFVDATEEFPFQVNREINLFGYSRHVPGVDCVLWPNSVLDRGGHLRDWLPKYELDLGFNIATAPVINPGVLVYASSEGVNKSWFPGRGPEYWGRVLKRVEQKCGRPATLIGSSWDESFNNRILGPRTDLVGETSLPEVAGLLKSANVFIGIISGMSILANHFRTPCTAIYPDKFLPGFLKAWIKDGTPYLPVKASMAPSPERLVDAAFELANHSMEEMAGR